MSIEKQSYIAYLGGEYVGGLFMHLPFHYGTTEYQLARWNEKGEEE